MKWKDRYYREFRIFENSCDQCGTIETEYVSATRFTEKDTVLINMQEVTADVGDYLVTREDGSQYIEGKCDFETKYTRVADNLL